MKSRISIFIATFLLSSFLFLQSGKAQTSTTPTGTGTLASPYQISTLNNLYWLSQTSAAWASGKYCIQTANIDASSTSTWASGAGFTPIGSTGGYYGNYNGQGFSIDGLTENRPAYADRAGMFYSTKTGAVIQNVVLTNVNIIGGGSGAALVSYQMDGSVSNCSSSGNVQGLYSIGGLIGAMDAGTVTKSYSTANVYGRLNLTNGVCIIGGFIGDHRGTATDCYATGNITGGQSYTGAGGFAGLCTGSIIRCYAAGTITGTGTKGGLVQYISGGTYTDSYYDKTLLPNSGPGTGKTTAEMKTQSTFTSWDFSTIWNINSAYNSGYPMLRAFTYFAAPTISSFTPTSAATGATVTITGTNFTGATSISFGGTAATSFSVVDATSITAVVASGTSGSVSVTSPGGTASLAGFTYIPPPTISSFTPTSAATGATVTITGTNFTGATAVSFGGTAANSFSVVSATSITAVVAGGTSGTVSVTTPNGTASLAGFTFIAAPTISSFTPTSAVPGATVTITGTNFTGATAVSFGGSAATSFTVVSATSITAEVASGTSGSVSVTTSGGTVSLAGFSIAPNTWTGGAGNWNVAGNWSYGSIPGSSVAVLISTGNPKMDVDVTIAGTLTINGTGSLTINPLKTLTISGTADFGGKLVTVKSDNTGSGSMGVMTGTLNGATNVTVERYIPNNTFRSWRLLSVPTYGSAQTINAAWQEGNAALANGTPGYGTQITSPSGTGFDDVSPNPSMFKYNGTALEAITNTGTAIATNQGYFLYVRGDRTVGVNTSSSSNTVTTLRTNGTLYTGTQTSATILANKYGLVGNPFASAINFASLTRTGGLTNAFYIWDAKKQSGNSLGVYQTFSSTNAFVPTIDGGSYSIVNPNTTIQSGQAFFVYAEITAGAVQIPESSKVASTGTIGYKTSADLVKIDSRLYSIASTTTMADANVVVFDVAYSNAVDGNDATKFSNTGENLGILRNGQTLVVEGRQPVTISDTIYFRMWNMQAHAYQLEFIPRNLGTQNLMAKLEDSYLNTSTTVNMSDTTRVDFTVDATPASYASNRFRVVIAPGVVLPVNFISVSASRKTTAVQVSWKVGNELSIRQYEVERSADGRNYTKAGTLAATGITAYSLLDANAPAGTLFYRVKSIGIAGEYKYSAVVKVAAENVNSGYAIVPNPVEGTEINVQFKNQAAGKYSIKLLNNNGQQMMITEVNYAGGNGTQTIQIPAGLARGTYQLEIISADKTSSTQSIFIKNK